MVLLVAGFLLRHHPLIMLDVIPIISDSYHSSRPVSETHSNSQISHQCDPEFILSNCILSPGIFPDFFLFAASVLRHWGMSFGMELLITGIFKASKCISHIPLLPVWTSFKWTPFQIPKGTFLPVLPLNSVPLISFSSALSLLFHSTFIRFHLEALSAQMKKCSHCSLHY